MDIPFVKRHSKFLAPCELRIRESREALLAGQPIRVEFTAEERGRSRRVTVTISEGRAADFGTDWYAVQASHFPQRICAAATALRDCGCWGTFVINHRDGTLEITRA